MISSTTPKSNPVRLNLKTIDFDLRVTVESLGDLLAVKAHEKGLEYVARIHHDVPSRLRGDPGRLRQILINLVGNAIKFTETGEIAIHLLLENEDNTHATVRFRVSDTGIGIPAGHMDRLFDSFSQADNSTTRKYGGTGLGAFDFQTTGRDDGWPDRCGEREGPGFCFLVHGNF
jgi:two-component system sensor histidine kinase/response regulator